MNFIEKISGDLARILYWVAGAAILAMMLITCADVVLRYFRMPIPGTYELVCFLGAVAVSCAMAHTSVQKGHVSVNFIIRLMPTRFQGLIESITGLFGVFLFAIIAWRSVLYGISLKASGEVSLTLQMPFYPFVYGVGFSAAAVCLVLLNDLLKSLRKVFG